MPTHSIRLPDNAAVVTNNPPAGQFLFYHRNGLFVRRDSAGNESLVGVGNYILCDQYRYRNEFKYW